MIEYTLKSQRKRSVNGRVIHNFLDDHSRNIDNDTVESFGEEWNKFSHFDGNEVELAKDIYFDIVTNQMMNISSIVLDMGCGSGRWSKYVAPKVKYIEAVDPSDAVLAAARLLKDESNVRITQAEVSNLPFPDNSFDFVFSLGVLHHIPDTKEAMRDTVKKLKRDGYFLVYLYYALDGRSMFFRLIFKLSNILRNLVYRLPSKLKRLTCDLLALLIYLPLILLAKVVGFVAGQNMMKKVPLYFYHDKSWNMIRNDSLDRFGTPLEQRFTKQEIRIMMEESGLTDIVFSDNAPFWHAVGRKA